MPEPEGPQGSMHLELRIMNIEKVKGELEFGTVTALSSHSLHLHDACHRRLYPTQNLFMNLKTQNKKI